MTAYTSQPYVVGQSEVLSEIFRNTDSQIMRIGIFGDSRTDPTQTSIADSRMETRLNYKCFQLFGQASETPIARMGANTRSSTVDPQFCIPVALAYGAASSNSASSPISDMPPEWDYYKANTTATANGIALGLDPYCTAVNSTFGDFPHGSYGPFFPDAGDAALVCDWFLRKDTATVATKIYYAEAADADATPTVGNTGINGAFSDTIDLSSSTGNVVKYTTPQLTNPGSSYNNVQIKSATGGPNAAYSGQNGVQVAGGRFRNTARSSGFGAVVQSFGGGAYDAAEILDLNGSMGPTIKTFGPYQVWFIILGANDYGSPSYSSPLTNYEGKIQDIIDFCRGSAIGGDSNTPIVLCNPYLRTSAGSSFNTFTASLIALAKKNANTVFLNIARALDEAGYDTTDSTNWTSDGVHINKSVASTVYFDSLWQLFMMAALRGSVRINEKNYGGYSMQSVDTLGRRAINVK